MNISARHEHTSGWVIGGGIDWAVPEELVVRGGYLHDYGSETYVDVDADLTSHTARGALVWNVGGL